jgi:ethanolamine utilization protein EutQ (cupin superfamily)
MRYMVINLKQKCDEAKNCEFYYGAKLNKDIKDVYLGMGYLEPDSKERKIGPPRHHEEILYCTNGRIEINRKGEQTILNEGEVYFMPNGKKIKVRNITDKRAYYIIAGGHTKPHSH